MQNMVQVTGESKYAGSTVICHLEIVFVSNDYFFPLTASVIFTSIHCVLFNFLDYRQLYSFQS